MAEVFLAVEECEHAGRRFVTIKRIRSEHVGDPDFTDFFLTEGRVTLRLAHPNLPQGYALGVVDGRYFLSMEFIHGHNLLEIIRASIRKGPPLSVAAVLTMALGVSAALEHAHGRCDVDGARLDVIHRDVTPQNIMVLTSGVVKLIDFGIVRAAIQVHETRTGIVKGKVAYMAPEQLRGRDHIDQRADLFALGVVMWESLCGRPLFRAASELETVQRVRSMPVPDPRHYRPDVPPPVSAVVLKALERNPNERYPGATAMMSALEQVAEHCRIVPSAVRMRREIEQLCGVPALPVVPPPLPPRPGDATLTARVETSRPRESGLFGDPLLVYFLRQTGARLPARAAQEHAGKS